MGVRNLLLCCDEQRGPLRNGPGKSAELVFSKLRVHTRGLPGGLAVGLGLRDAAALCWRAGLSAELRAGQAGMQIIPRPQPLNPRGQQGGHAHAHDGL